jgi:nucleoside-diphosphate-sugar epimerase
LTGGFGNVGTSTLDELLRGGADVRVFEADTKRNRKTARKYEKCCELHFGDIRSPDAVLRALEGVDSVIHLAAIIPPLADRNPSLAATVNVGGTRNIIEGINRGGNMTKLIFASSIAVYGDRVNSPYIKASDNVDPNPDDTYAKTKVECEKMIRASGIRYAILRLTYVVSERWLPFDPLFFRMPLETSIETCDTRDVGRAFAHAVRSDAIWGKTLNIAGGKTCRMSFREYLDRVFSCFGLGGSGFLPRDAFRKQGYHCGFLEDADESEAILHYRRRTLEDYFSEVRKVTRTKRFFISMVRPAAHAYLKKLSPYLVKRNQGRGKLSEA